MCSANEGLGIIPLTGPETIDLGLDGDLDCDLESALPIPSLSARGAILITVTVDTLALAALKPASSGSSTSNAMDRGLRSTNEFCLLVLRREFRAEFLRESTGELLLEFALEFLAVPVRDALLRFAQPALAASVGEVTVFARAGLETSTGDDCRVAVRLVRAVLGWVVLRVRTGEDLLVVAREFLAVFAREDLVPFAQDILEVSSKEFLLELARVGLVLMTGEVGLLLLISTVSLLSSSIGSGLLIGELVREFARVFACVD